MSLKLIFQMVLIGMMASSPARAQQTTFHGAGNPILYADVPDMSIIRVGDLYYMSSTTMHMSPGLPIMKSSDMVNWKLVNYAYDTLANVDALNLENGKSSYGKGFWASSLRYYKGTYYVSTFSLTTNKTYIYSTKNIEESPWRRISFSPALHDHSLFFDDNGKVYMISGSGTLRIVELKKDVSGIMPGGLDQTLLDNASLLSGSNGGLPAEGSQIFKVKGKYFLFNITWPRGGMRTVVIHRADKITGPYEGKMGLQDLGVAQAGLIETSKGAWFAYLFRDFGAVGRVPYWVPVSWEDGWPVLGINGKVPESLKLPPSRCLIPGLVASDEFIRKKGEKALPLVWQWNHNPENNFWSVSERKGYLRLTTSRIDTDFLMARNTLTQRTIGQVCSGIISLDVSAMKEGDFAGLGLLQKNYGLAGVKIIEGAKFMIMINASMGKPLESERIPIFQNTVFFKVECDFLGNPIKSPIKNDIGNFYYSLDGKIWKPLGTALKMVYSLPHFMGYRFALFYYATQEIGGQADFDFFRISHEISRNPNQIMNATN